jgi:cysteine desulfurase
MTLKFPIYMDNHATTPVDPRVLSAMLPYFTETFGNAASRTHAYGWTAEAAVDDARDTIAQLIGAESGKEIVFTSGATESDNLAIKGVAEYYKAKGNHIITTTIEHKAVLDSCKRLEKEGYTVTYINVGPDGLIGKITRARGVLLHSDAVQGLGKTPFDVREMNVDLASLTAHKVYGPKGVGALYVRRSKPRVRLSAQMDGGGHERGNRSGTLNVPGIVGFAKACKILIEEGKSEAERIRGMRERLHQKIVSELDAVVLNGSAEHRLPGNLNLSFSFVEGEGLMMAIKDVAVSSGSACTSASLEPSYVLRSMGLTEDMAHSSIRFGLGRFNTDEEVDYVAELVIAKVKRLRDMSPLYEMHKAGIDLKSIQWAAH